MKNNSTFHYLVGNASDRVTLSNSELSNLLSLLKVSKVDDCKLPLAKCKYPFKELSDEIIIDAVKNTLCVDNKIGRISDLIRKYLDIVVANPSISELYIESHIDLTSAPGCVESFLIKMGYEPDDFVELKPECYKKHFTLKVSMEMGDPEYHRAIKGCVVSASKIAFDYIQSTPAISGFVENEIYTTKYKKKYIPNKLKIYNPRDFPKELRLFRVQIIPNRPSEEELLNICVPTEKRADIHIKTSEGNPEFETDLIKSGFYYIKSEASNTIYTGQYLSLLDAKQCFSVLHELCEKTGVAKSLILEICTSLWRTHLPLTNGEMEYAEISPVLVKR